MLLQEAKTAVETAIEQAKETCDSGTTQECAAAWDEVCARLVPKTRKMSGHPRLFEASYVASSALCDTTRICKQNCTRAPYVTKYPSI